ncbi:hypothetical protein, partial [Okeania sp. SIO3B5]|uniref:hypothetical protein n=1 Tax=Okeania sp. SIO3B5 TaxID=2607811 RepID=UPI0025F7E2FB
GMALWGYSSKHCEIPPVSMVLPSHCYERFSQLLPGIAGLDVSALSYQIRFIEHKKILQSS